jgi:hypothetical protein
MRLIAKQVTKQLGDGSTLEMALEVAAGKPLPAQDGKAQEFKPEVSIDLTQLTEGESEAKQGMMKKSLNVLKESFSKGARCAAIPISADQAKAKKKSSAAKRKSSGEDSATKKSKSSKDGKKKAGGLGGAAGDVTARSRNVGALLTFLASDELMKAEAGMTPSIRDRPSQLSIPSPTSSSFPAPLSSVYRGRSPHAPPGMQVLPTPYGAPYGFPGTFDFGYADALPSPVNMNNMFPLSPLNREAMGAAAGQHGYFFGPGGNVMPHQTQPTQMPAYWAAPGYAPIEGGAPYMKNKF